MVIIGQNINACSPAVREVFRARDEAALLALAARQRENGAAILDVNADFCEDPAESLLWAMRALTRGGHRLMPDSVDPRALAFALEAFCPVDCVVNSVTPNEESLRVLLPLLKKHGLAAVAMPVRGGMPGDAEEYMETAARLCGRLRESGAFGERLYIDILVTPALDGDAEQAALDRAARLREAYPDARILAGVSNVSFGLSDRGARNRAFLRRCVERGADSFLLDALDTQIIRIPNRKT